MLSLLTDRPDENPEAILIGKPLDSTQNPEDVKVGDSIGQITGIVTYAFGDYRILPRTSLKITGSQEPASAPPTTIQSAGSCSGLTVGDYNIENLNSSATTRLSAAAKHVLTYLKSPDLVFLQEIQDSDGTGTNGMSSIDTHNLNVFKY